ncbi:hypothetical protein ACB094_01G083300 [Castanea mollissima]
MAAEKGVVCVTGAGGFIGSWVVNLLLSNDYVGDAKYAHLNKFENASNNLRLFKADLLDYSSIRSAVEGCIGVFHVASPVPSTTITNPEARIKLVENLSIDLLKTIKFAMQCWCSYLDINFLSWPKGQVIDETSWADKEYCKTTQPTVNATSLIIIGLLKDVRDVARALLLTYEKPEAEGRYICAAQMTNAKDVVDLLKSIHPNYNYPNKFTEVLEDERMSSEKLKRLGWSYRPLKETLIDAIESYQIHKHRLVLDRNDGCLTGSELVGQACGSELADRGSELADRDWSSRIVDRGLELGARGSKRES